MKTKRFHVIFSTLFFFQMSNPPSHPSSLSLSLAATHLSSPALKAETVEISPAKRGSEPVSIPSSFLNYPNISKSLVSPEGPDLYSEDASKSLQTGSFIRKRTGPHGRHSRNLSLVECEEDDEEFDAIQEFWKASPSLPLTPFTNQVGGHASFLRFSDKALCKPCKREMIELFINFCIFSGCARA